VGFNLQSESHGSEHTPSRGELACGWQGTYVSANAKSAINTAASSCIAGMACE
jgi:hypothetical protein